VTRTRRTFAACLVTLALWCSGAVLVGAEAVTPDSLTLQAKGANGTDVSGSAQIQVGGDTTVSIKAVNLDGGRMTVTSGPDAALPTAVDFPDYVSTGTTCSSAAGTARPRCSSSRWTTDIRPAS
jgi:hypothetical protein